MSVLQNSSSEKIAALSTWAFNPEGRGPRLWRTLFFINPVIILFFTVLLNGVGPYFLNHLFYGILIGNTVSLTCFASRSLVIFIGKRIMKVQLARRTNYLASLGGMLPGLWLGFIVAGNVARTRGEEWPVPSLRDYSSGIAYGSIIFGLIVLLDLWFESKKRAALFENESLQAKLSALSAQMNPHLLFNSLNTIAATIATNPQAAEETTVRLSELYRGILASSKKTTQSIASELEICRAYFEIESSRFGERLRWKIEVEPSLEEVEIPSLLIQPLVENAVKHGISQKASGGFIGVKIFRDENEVQILVEDDGVGLGNSSAKHGTGTGVSSCRSRLELAYGGLANFEIGARSDGNGTRVKISIPKTMKEWVT